MPNRLRPHYAAHMRHLILLVMALLPAACTSTQDPGGPGANGIHGAGEAFEADGRFVRHVRLRVAPAQTKEFEALIKRCVEAAQAVGLPDEHHWLCYREPPGRYWLVLFSEERDGFAIPDSERPLRAFARHVADLESADARAEVDERLAALEYEIEWTWVLRQKKEWSTALKMTTETHAKARLMLRRIRPGHGAAFDRALAERVAFLVDQGYPLPVEGFVTLSGVPDAAVQAVFPRDWPSFHGGESFWEFIQRLPEPDRERYMQRKGALMETMLSAEYYDAAHVPEASYRGE